MTILFKYRDISSGELWKRIFSHNEFWLSVHRHLDDEDEVSFEWKIAEHLRDHRFHPMIQNGTSILSLGQDQFNNDLWNRYGGKGEAGFCIEADFSHLSTIDYMMGPSPVTYISGHAKAQIDLGTIMRFSQNAESEVQKIWSQLFLEKNSAKWHQQNEIRFLHFEPSPDASYAGRTVQLPVGSLKTVYVQKNISSKFKDQLSEQVKIANARGESSLTLKEI